MQKTYILRYAKIPWFESENLNHMRIVELSKKASRLPRGWRSRTIPAHLVISSTGIPLNWGQLNAASIIIS